MTNIINHELCIVFACVIGYYLSFTLQTTSSGGKMRAQMSACRVASCWKELPYSVSKMNALSIIYDAGCLIMI